MASKWVPTCLVLLAFFMVQGARADLAPLNESELANVTGQALIDTTKHIGDGTSTNGTSGIALTNLPLGTAQTPVPNCFGFYKFC